MVSDLGFLNPLSSAFRLLIDVIGFHNIVDAPSFDPVLSYVAYYRNHEVDWSVGHLSDPFMLGHFMAGHVKLWAQEVVSGRKHDPGHRPSDRLLGSVQICHCKGSFLTVCKSVRTVCDLLGRSVSGV